MSVVATQDAVSSKPVLLDWLAQAAQDGDLSGLDGAEVTWAFRAVHPDLRSREGFRYPWPGNWAVAPGPIKRHKNSCPQAKGDGLCIAKTFCGAAAGGIPFSTMLLVGYTAKDVLGEDENKVRVRRMYVADLLSIATILRYADLGYADLRYADLRYADLRYANLRYANLGSADLRYADLRYANLGYANLRYANLGYADLGSANLRYANLGYANLRYANLGYADLRYANLRSADLRYANLRSATYNQLTLWPEGFDPVAAGAVAV